MCQLARRSRRAGWLIERALWLRPGHARRRACRAPLASAGSTAPKPPRKHRAQHQHAAHQAAECCTGVQRTLRRCGAASPPCPRSRRAAARPSTSCRRCALPGGSTGCSLRIRSFTQRSVRATPRKADKRLSVEGLAARTRLLRGHALRTGERATREGTQPLLEFCLEHLECSYQPHIQGRGAKKRTQDPRIIGKRNSPSVAPSRTRARTPSTSSSAIFITK